MFFTFTNEPVYFFAFRIRACKWHLLKSTWLAKKVKTLSNKGAIWSVVGKYRPVIWFSMRSNDVDKEQILGSQAAARLKWISFQFRKWQITGEAASVHKDLFYGREIKTMTTLIAFSTKRKSHIYNRTLNWKSFKRNKIILCMFYLEYKVNSWFLTPRDYTQPCGSCHLWSGYITQLIINHLITNIKTKGERDSALWYIKVVIGRNNLVYAHLVRGALWLAGFGAKSTSLYTRSSPPRT